MSDDNNSTTARPREVLFFASYCGDDNAACSARRPCPVCLGMSNVYEIPADTQITYKRELAPHWLGDKALEKIAELLDDAPRSLRERS